MARNKSQAAAFDIMTGFSSNPTPILPGGPMTKESESDTPPSISVAVPKEKTPSKVASKPTPKKSQVVKSSPRARNGSTPCERTLKARNILLFEDQMRPLALLEIDSGENRSELIRRLVDDELKAQGYLK
ncbi:MAG: hypothetical protein RR547_00905 [Raoultibacter sp.]